MGVTGQAGIRTDQPGVEHGPRCAAPPCRRAAGTATRSSRRSTPDPGLERATLQDHMRAIHETTLVTGRHVTSDGVSNEVAVARHLRMTACCAPRSAATRRRPPRRAGPSRHPATPRTAPAARRRRTAACRHCPTCTTPVLTEQSCATRRGFNPAGPLYKPALMQHYYATAACRFRLQTQPL